MIDYKFVKRIAKMYRNQHPDYTIRKSVFKALEAYEFYKETEVDVQDEYYDREVF